MRRMKTMTADMYSRLLSYDVDAQTSFSYSAVLTKVIACVHI